LVNRSVYLFIILFLINGLLQNRVTVTTMTDYK